MKIACVGDSITYGFLLFPRHKMSYPSVLQRLLGKEFAVQNFGVNGATLTQSGNRPYMKQRAYVKSLKFQPDVVVIMLSTNDTRTMNRDIDNFESDYVKLIDSYRKMQATIIVMSSPEIYCVHQRYKPYYGMDESLLESYRIIIAKIATEQHLLYLDLHAISLTYSACFRLDGVHPNKQFAKVMAQAVADKIQQVLQVEDRSDQSGFR